jgi:WhiB family transcriptional regulator, redox-sensing transcriptional regulator
MSMSDFRDRAACRDTDPELFFPIGTGGPALAQIGAAKAVCRRCQVTPECLSWAILTGQRDGIWGGLDPLERHELRRREARASLFS